MESVTLKATNINILGSEWSIDYKTPETDKVLSNARGYANYASRSIVINMSSNGFSTADEYVFYLKKVLRHEIIHAFLFESGLGENFEHRKRGHEETIVDWFALQFPKIYQAFCEADCLGIASNKSENAKRKKESKDKKKKKK